MLECFTHNTLLSERVEETIIVPYQVRNAKRPRLCQPKPIILENTPSCYTMTILSRLCRAVAVPSSGN